MARVLQFELADPEEATFAEQREYTRRYLALTDEPEGALLALYQFNPALQRGSLHPHDPGARVEEFRAKQVPGRTVQGFRFEIEVRWSSAVPADEDENPLERPAEIEWSTWEEERPLTRDNDGNPIVNTAGSPLLELNEVFRHWQLTVKKNVEAVPRWVLNYSSAVNADTVTIDGIPFEPRTLAMQALRIGPVQRDEKNNVEYRELSFTLQHHPDTWDRRPLNRGFYERTVKVDRTGAVIVGSTVVPILDGNGEPITEPRFLDERGIQPRLVETDADGFKKLKVKDPLEPSDIVVLRFRTRPALPFRVLPLT